MRKNCVFSFVLAFLVCSLDAVQLIAVLCAFTKPAYAYVDPGSGLLALQVASTTMAGVLFFVRKRLHRFLKAMQWIKKDECEVKKSGA